MSTTPRELFQAARRLHRIGQASTERGQAVVEHVRLTNEMCRANGMVASLHPRASQGLWPRDERPMISRARALFLHELGDGSYRRYALRQLSTTLFVSRGVPLYRFGPGARLAQMEMLAMAARCVTAAQAWKRAA